MEIVKDEMEKEKMMAIKTYRLRNPELLHIPDGEGKWSSGCDQDWFGTEWQRRAGCGPSVASNIMIYLHASGVLQMPYDIPDKAGCLRLMEDMWNHVTPTRYGVNTVQLFSDGLHSFAGRHGYRLDCDVMLYPKQPDKRADLRKVAAFLADGLALDCPVAFLNLSNGEVDNLDSWHWVTIVRMDADMENDLALIEIYDGNSTAMIDLKTWCATTTEDGGFVHFRRIG